MTKVTVQGLAVILCLAGTVVPGSQSLAVGHAPFVLSAQVSGVIAHRSQVSAKRRGRGYDIKIIRYRVRRGENLRSIARKFRVTRRQLIRRNHLRRPYRLRTGRRLYIKSVRVYPAPKRRRSRRTSKYKSKRRSGRHSVKRVVVRKQRKTRARKVVKTVRVKTYRHRVRRGETIRTIARGYRVSRRQLIRLNHLRRPYRVPTGRVLIIKRVRTVIVKRVPVSVAEAKRSRRKATTKRVVRIKSKLSPNSKRKPESVTVTKTYKPKKPPSPMRVRTYTHRIRRGDTIRSLAKRYSVSRNQLIRINRLRSPYHLRAGRKIIIKRVMVTAGYDEFGLGNKSDWKQVKDGELKQKNNHKKTVKIRNSSIINNNGAKYSGRQNGTTNTSHGSVIRSDPVKGGFMRRRGRWMWPANGKVEGRFSSSAKGIKIRGRLGQDIVSAGKGRVVYIGNSLIRYGNLVIIKHNNTFFTAYAHNQRLFVREGQYVHRGQKIAEMGSAASGKVVLHFEVRKDGRPVDPLIYLPRK